MLFSHMGIEYDGLGRICILFVVYIVSEYIYVQMDNFYMIYDYRRTSCYQLKAIPVTKFLDSILACLLLTNLFSDTLVC